MSDAKKLIENLRSLARFEHADLSLGDEAADWIERWAPVVDAACAEAKAADAVIDSRNTYMHTQSVRDYRAHQKAGNTLREATKTLREAVAAALGEDKP